MATAPAPQTIGRYQVLGELGKGAMGVVYKAQDPTIGRTVALKTMRVDVGGIEAQEMLDRFRNEARAAGVLNHPNIVTVYDAGEETGHFYMALECIEGQTLQQMMQRQRVLPAELVIDVARQVCAGLDYAHDHGIIHRDIKPANIMITPDGTAKIMDFGIAKGIGVALTTTGQVMGTPNYMSPEQVKGRPLDGRSDLFSLGVILYEVVTGEKPFSGDNITTIVYKIVNENPVSPRELDVTIHPGLSAIITKALAKNLDERYQRGAELARDLLNYKSIASDTEITLRMATASAAEAPTPPSGPRVQMPHAAAPVAAKAPVVAASHAPAATPAAHHHHKSEKPLMIALACMLALAAGMAAVAGVRHYRKAQEAAQQQADVAPAASLPAAGSAEQPAPPSATPSSGEDEQPTAPDTVRKTTVARNQQHPAPSPTAAAPTVAAPAGNEQLTVTSLPAGAKVQIDGHSQAGWVTPFTARDLAAGPHTVILSKEGYLPESRVLDLAPGKKGNVAVSLNSRGGMLALKSTPAGAKIFVDNSDSGKVTPAQVKVPAGAHAVTLKLDGYKDAAASATLNQGDTFNFAPTLEKAPTASQTISSPFKKLFGGGIPAGQGQVEVKSKPKGAAILVNGRKFDKPTPAKIDLDPGTYTLTVQMDGYKAYRTQVQIEKGKSTKIEPRLDPSK